VEVKLSPQIPGTDLKVLGFNIGAQVARGVTVPAGWVFLADDSARIMNPPTGGLGGNNTAESRTRIT
jgi:putative polyketide hydroxylase